MISTTQSYLASTQLPGPMHAQLLDIVGMTGVQHSKLWQQDATLQPSVVLPVVMVPQSSPLQHLQQVSTEQPLAQLQVAGNVDVSKLKALLQDVLRLPDSEMPEKPATGAPLQGKCVMLGAPQQPPSLHSSAAPAAAVCHSIRPAVLVGGPEPGCGAAAEPHIHVRYGEQQLRAVGSWNGQAVSC